jgi:hypothetical protein
MILAILLSSDSVKLDMTFVRERIVYSTNNPPHARQFS